MPTPLTKPAVGAGDGPEVTAGLRDVVHRHPFRVRIAAIALLGLLLRFAYVRATWSWVPHSDNHAYLKRGLYLWEHNWHLWPLAYPHHVVLADGYWPPVYPAFLAVMVATHQLLHLVNLLGPVPHVTLHGRTVGPGLLSLVQYLRVVMSGLGAVMIIATAAIARRLFGPRVALVAALIVAVYPPLIYVGASLYSEALFVPEMMCALACMVEYQQRRKWPWLVACGLVTGLSSLTHSDGVILVLTLLVALWVRPRLGRRRTALESLALIGLVAIVIAPWTIRNAVKLHGFVPIGLSAGPTLAGTYNPISDHSQKRPAAYVLPDRAYPGIQRHHWRPGIRQSTAYEHAAFNYIGHHPEYLAKVLYWNSIRLFELFGPNGPNGSEWSAALEGIPLGFTWAGDICFWLIALLAVAGCFTRAVRMAPKWIWITPLTMYLSVVFLNTETPRFRAPIDPFLILLAAPAMVAARDWIAGRAEKGTHTSPAIEAEVSEPARRISLQE